MDEVQSWWEVPSIAHFCYVFRAAFNLYYFEIGELEAAILNMQDPEMCMSLEQLIIRLLEGCYEENEVSSNNWEEKLHELFNDNCEDGENLLQNNAFDFLSPRLKVEVLFKLCEFRLDAEGVLEAIKDIRPEDMHANCIGKDSQNNLYWYFFDERLYKEDPSIPAKKPGKSKQQSEKGKIVKNSAVKKSTRERKSKSEDVNKPWSIVCHNLSEWETLLKTFSKSKHKQEKELAKEIKDKYLPLLEKVVAEKDRLLRKRFLELAPKRVSQRLSKVQAQRKLEEQMVEEANEQRQFAMEQERNKKEAEKKKEEKDARRKRAEAREQKIEERTRRAQQRNMMRGLDVENFSSDEERTDKSSRNVQIQNPDDDEDEESSEEEEAVAASDDENASQSEPESEESAKRHSSNSEISDSDEETNNSSTVRKVCANNGNSVFPNHVQQKSFGGSNVHNSYGVSNWNVGGNSKGQKIHIVRYAYDPSAPSNKRLKPNESNYNNGSVNSVSTNDAKPSYYNKSTYHSVFERSSYSNVTSTIDNNIDAKPSYYNKSTYRSVFKRSSDSNVTSTPQIIRIDFLKPPKPQV